jgi:capsular polysaccharide biosynthesis protein
MGVTELRDHLRVRPGPQPGSPPGSSPDRRWLRAGALIVPLVLALSVGTAYVVTSRQTPTYRSSATLVLVPSAAILESPDLLRSLETLERRTVIATFAQIPSADRIRVTAARDIALQPDSLGYFVSQAFVIPNTNLLRIEAEGPDAARAAAFANALAATTRAEAKTMYRVFEMTTLAAAVQPAVPVAPNPRRAVALAAILGAALGVAATYLFVRPRTSPGALA